MTLNALTWATLANYSTGPDSGTPTKVNPSSSSNGFVSGVVAAPQHVNYLVNQIAAELLKAIDGVGGGSYTLSNPLTFMGADVRIGADLEVLGTGQINVQDGGEINVLDGGRIDIEDGAGLHLDAGSELDLDGNADLAAAAVFTVHGEIALATSGAGELSVASGAIINVNTGGRVDLNTDSEMNVEGTAHIDVEGKIAVSGGGQLNLGTVADHVGASAGEANVGFGALLNVNSGGVLVVQDGGRIISEANGLVTLEDSNDLTINNSAEGYRLTLTPAFNDGLAPWATTSPASGLAGWVQFDVAARRTITFPLPIPEGDTVVDVFVRVNGDPSGGGAHGGVPPTNVPSIELFSVDVDGVEHVHATKNDAVSGGSYDTTHNIVLQSGSTTTGTMPHLATFDPLYVRIKGEQGGSAAAAKLTLLSISGNVIARSYRSPNMVY